MHWYPDRIPDWVSSLFSGYLFHGDRNSNKVFLTFDDGPTPGVTDFVLEQLAAFGFSATFFCIGKNIDQHPNILNNVLKNGHMVGSHTQNHLNGWKTDNDTYIKNVCEADNKIGNKLFRPPYGRIKMSVAKKLSYEEFEIVMWDVLSGDFDLKRSPESVLKNLKKNTRPGSIIVFHDSKKAEPTLRNVLPKYLQFLKENNWKATSLIYEMGS